MRKICVFTGSQAEYGLLRSVMREIQAAETLQLQILVSGMHLSPIAHSLSPFNYSL